MESLEAALAPYLQPITSSLPKPLADAALALLGDKCYNVLLLRFHISDPVCLKLAISKALGVGIIGASSVVKIPQLLKILNSQSAAGVSFLSYLLETVAYLITLAYNVRQEFPFSTFGETALIAIQDVAIALAVLHFSRQDAAAAAYIAFLAAAGYALFSAQVVDAQTLSYLQAGAGVLGVAAKVPQILAIWQQGGTGQLSAFAVFNYLIGSLTRIYTTLQEVDDKLILYGFISGFALNAVLALQMIYYWNSPTSSKSKSSKLTHKGKENFASPTKSSKSKSAAGSTPTKNKSPTTRRRG